jgi:hypothetical protein
VTIRTRELHQTEEEALAELADLVAAETEGGVTSSPGTSKNVDGLWSARQWVTLPGRRITAGVFDDCEEWEEFDG